VNRIDCGRTQPSDIQVPTSWADLDLAQPWAQVMEILRTGPHPRPIQVKAIAEGKVLEGRRNLIVSSPTNSGKSLVAHLVLLDAIRRGGRALLLEPLRALAREKADELASVGPVLSDLLGRKFRVKLTTGDYRLEDEEFGAPPPGDGELVVATPERVEAILRRPEHSTWLDSVRAVAVDEAHMLSSRRGPSLEYLLTTLLGLPAPPRLVLLSATLGNTDRLQGWLTPADVLQSSFRTPPVVERDMGG
jgi:helicase